MERKSIIQSLIDEGYICINDNYRSADLEEKMQERISMALHEYGAELAEKEERWKDVINAYEISHYQCRNNYPEKIGDIYENKIGDYEHARRSYDGMQKPELRQAGLSRKMHRTDEEIYLLCERVIRDLQDIQYKSILYLRDNAYNKETDRIPLCINWTFCDTESFLRDFEELFVRFLDISFFDLITDKTISSIEHVLSRFKEEMKKQDNEVENNTF